MKTYAYVIRVVHDRGPIEFDTGLVSCDGFHAAVELVLSTETVSWKDKRAARELVSLTRVDYGEGTRQ